MERSIGRAADNPPRLRAVMVQLHRYVGLGILVFLVVAAGTGTVLVFDRSLDAALNPDLFSSRGARGTLTAVELAARVERQDPGLIVISVPLTVQAGRNVEISVAPRPPASGTAMSALSSIGFDQVFVAPATGRIVGVRQDRPGWDRRHLMRGIYLLHFTLLAGDGGRWFMGAMALLWALENIAGLYLTLPRRRPFWGRWAPAWRVNPRARAQRLLLDLHRASGLWLFGGVMILSLTSFALNYYAEVALPLARALSPPNISPWDRPAPAADWRSPRLTFDQAERRAVLDAGRDGLRLRPAVATYDVQRRLVGIRFTRDGLEQYAGLGPISYYYDDQSGRLVFVDNPMADRLGQKALRALYPLHSGQVGGLITRWLVALLGLAVLEMSLSGLMVWGIKRRARKSGGAAD